MTYPDDLPDFCIGILEAIENIRSLPKGELEIHASRGCWPPHHWRSRSGRPRPGRVLTGLLNITHHRGKLTSRRTDMKTTRRQFIGSVTAAAAATIVPRHVLGGPRFVPPSEKVNVALVGAGGQGRTNTRALFQEPDVQVIAVADPAEHWNLDAFYYKGDAGRKPVKAEIETHYGEKTPNFRCAEYEDFRVMLEKEKAVDAILCATPDHLHAYVSVLAMRSGKHVYCEKPLTHNIWEARKVAQVAKETGVATQLGNHGHSRETHPADLRVDLGRRDRPGPRGPDLGASRTVQQVAHGQARGCGRHARRSQLGLVAGAARAAAVPSGLRPGHLARFLGLRHGDDGRLRLPRPGQLAVGPRPGHALERGGLPGGQHGRRDRAPRRDLLLRVWSPRRQAPGQNHLVRRRPATSLAEGHGRRGGHCPTTASSSSATRGSCSPKAGPASSGCCPTRRPPPTRSRRRPCPVPRDITATGSTPARAGRPPAANFQYGAKLTELVLLGVLALRLGKRIAWDAVNLKVPGVADADALINEPRRKGWEIV